ncbi:unnamed protein product [Lampetra fluviatilis]
MWQRAGRSEVTGQVRPRAVGSPPLGQRAAAAHAMRARGGHVEDLARHRRTEFVLRQCLVRYGNNSIVPNSRGSLKQQQELTGTARTAGRHGNVVSVQVFVESSVSV